MNLINARLNRVLTAAEIGLPPENYQAFRKFVLDEFGAKGFETELNDLCRPECGIVEMERNGMGRSKSGMKGG